MPRGNPVITHIARAVEAYAERLAGTDPLGSDGNEGIDYREALQRLAGRFYSDEHVQSAVWATLCELQTKLPRKPRSVK